jgi:hypothetical protein
MIENCAGYNQKLCCRAEKRDFLKLFMGRQQEKSLHHQLLIDQPQWL